LAKEAYVIDPCHGLIFSYWRNFLGQSVSTRVLASAVPGTATPDMVDGKC
jgi:hypothetical protein